MIDQDKSRKWREEISNLSNIDLLDELRRPVDDWKEDVIREALYRLLKQSLSKTEPSSKSCPSCKGNGMIQIGTMACTGTCINCNGTGKIS